MNPEIRELSTKLIQEYKANNLYLTTIESCTGGGLVNAITNISGSSEIIKESFVTYSTEAKIRLGVSSSVIEQHTVYSIETALEMAKVGKADVGIGITGSLTREDPANPNSKPGTAYLAAVYGKRSLTKSLIL